MEDRQIIDLYWARSQQAVTESDRKYGAYCRAVSMNVLGAREDAEECVNDTWLHAWNAMPPQRPAVLQAFFGKLTRNLSLDRRRRVHAAKRGGGQTAVALEELADCLPSRGTVEDALDADETARVISKFLRSLSKTDRALFLRRYWYLDDVGAIARRFGMTQGQVKTRLYRVRGRLRPILEEEGICV